MQKYTSFVASVTFISFLGSAPVWRCFCYDPCDVCVCVCLFVCVSSMCVCVCVCVCERERERERECP